MAGRRTLLLGAAATIAVATAVVVAVISSGTTSGDRAGADPAHTVTGPMRTLVVSASMPAPSEPGLLLHAQLRRGSMPSHQVQARVLTDEHCAPDAAGISHCRNVLRLEDGRIIVVRHPHDMRQVPCLTPGEQVVVRPGSA